MPESIREFAERTIRSIAAGAGMDYLDLLRAVDIRFVCAEANEDGRINFDSIVDNIIAIKFEDIAEKSNEEKMRLVGIDPTRFAIVPRWVCHEMSYAARGKVDLEAAYHLMVEAVCPNPNPPQKVELSSLRPWQHVPRDKTD